MKILFTLLFFWAFAGNISYAQKTMFCLKGQIMFSKDNHLYIKSRDYRVIDTCKISPSGFYQTCIPLEKPQFLIFNHGAREIIIYAEPGKKTDLFFNADMEGVPCSFQKDFAVYNSYLNIKGTILRKMGYKNPNRYDKSNEEYISYTNRMYNAMDSLLQSMSENTEIWDNERLFVKCNKILHWLLYMKSIDPFYLFTEDPSFDEQLGFSSICFRKELLVSNVYRSFLVEYARSLILSKNQHLMSGQNADMELFMDVHEGISDPEFRDYIIGKWFNDLNKSKPYILMQKIEEYARTYCSDSTILSGINKKMEFRKAIYERIPVIEMNGLLRNDEMLKISDLRGQIIYLDFWHNGCSHCIKAFPELENFARKFKSKEVKIVCASIDPNIKRWKEICAEKGNTLLHINIYENKDAILKQLHVTGYPHYLLLDKNGRILMNPAPGPAKGIDKVLDRLGI